MLKKLPVNIDDDNNTYYNISTVYHRFNNSKVNNDIETDFRTLLIEEYIKNNPECETPKIIIKNDNEVRFYCKLNKRKVKKNISVKTKNKIRKLKYKILSKLREKNTDNILTNFNDNFLE